MVHKHCSPTHTHTQTNQQPNMRGQLESSCFLQEEPNFDRASSTWRIRQMAPSVILVPSEGKPDERTWLDLFGLPIQGLPFHPLRNHKPLKQGIHRAPLDFHRVRWGAKQGFGPPRRRSKTSADNSNPSIEVLLNGRCLLARKNKQIASPSAVSVGNNSKTWSTSSPPQ